MTLQIQLSASTIQSALEDLLESLFSVKKSDIRPLLRSSLNEQAIEIQHAIISEIITIHPLRKIIEAALIDVTDHAKAIDMLNGSKTCLLHVRHIEEVFTVVKYILHNPHEYNEFSWRWKNYPTVHWIRNRLLNLKEPINKEMQAWIDENIGELKEFVNDKFVTESQQCVKLWKEYGNWLYPKSLKKIFESTDRSNSYISAEYDWNSHAVHFSPLADDYYNINLDYLTYAEFASESAIRYLNCFCRESLAIVSDRIKLRTLHAKNIYLNAFRMLDDKPQWYINMANKGGRYAQLTEFLISRDRTLEKAIVVALGEEPEDPLVIRSTE